MTIAAPSKAYAEVYNPRTMKWNPDKLASLTPEDWRGWVRDRLRGNDDVHGYGREDYPDHTAALFSTVAAVCRKGFVDMKNAREGATKVLEDISPADENTETIANAMYALRHFSEPELDDGAETVAGWIRGGALLKREDGHDLQRVALASLAVLQKLRGGRYQELWQEYFCEKKDDPRLPTPWFYVATAFAGKVLDADKPPVEDIVAIIKMNKKSEQSGESIPASNALMAYWRLWSARPAIVALAERFEKLGSEAPRLWKTLSKLSERWQPLPNWEGARAAYIPTERLDPARTGSPWHRHAA